MAIGMKMGGFYGSGTGGESTLPPQITNLKLDYKYTADTVIKVDGSFNNVPDEHKKYLKDFVITYKSNEIPSYPDDGTQIIISDVSKAVITFSLSISNVHDGAVYGFRVFPRNHEDMYQTINDAKNNVKIIKAAKISSINSSTWEQISKIAKTGQAANYWSIGDTKEVEINGAVKNVNFSGKYYCFILGFNHNETIEGKGIHFQFGKTALKGGKDIAYCSPEYGGTWKPNGKFVMNSYNSNDNGWSQCSMRTAVCKQFYDALPMDLKNVIINCKKYTDNKGGGSTSPQNVTMTMDKIFLLSEFEILGTQNSAHPSERNYQKQYTYYQMGNSRTKYNHTNSNSAVKWWTRCPVFGGVNGYVYVNEGGSTFKCENAVSEFGFAPAFAV